MNVFFNNCYFTIGNFSKRRKRGSSEMSSLDLDKRNSYPYSTNNAAGSLLTEPPCCPSSPQHGKELEDNKVRYLLYLEPIFSFEGLYFCAVICSFHVCSCFAFYRICRFSIKLIIIFFKYQFDKNRMAILACLATLFAEAVVSSCNCEEKRKRKKYLFDQL